MKWFNSILFFVAWALWFGGAVAILLFVQRLFHDDRQLALEAAPKLFLTFEKYQIVLAAVAIISLVGADYRKRSGALSPLILIAAVLAISSAFGVTPRIEALRVAGQTQTSAFHALHGVSMLIYLTEVIMLLLAGILLARPTLHSARVAEESSFKAER